MRPAEETLLSQTSRFIVRLGGPRNAPLVIDWYQILRLSYSIGEGELRTIKLFLRTARVATYILLMIKETYLDLRKLGVSQSIAKWGRWTILSRQTDEGTRLDRCEKRLDTSSGYDAIDTLHSAASELFSGSFDLDDIVYWRHGLYIRMRITSRALQLTYNMYFLLVWMQTTNPSKHFHYFLKKKIRTCSSLGGCEINHSLESVQVGCCVIGVCYDELC